jgi:hypothetical protein
LLQLLELAVAGGPIPGSLKIFDICFYLPQDLALLFTTQCCIPFPQPVAVERAVAVTRLLAVRGQPVKLFDAVLAQQVVQVKPALWCAPDETLIDQSCQLAQGYPRCLLRRLAGKTAAEDRQTGQDGLLARAQQIP